MQSNERESLLDGATNSSTAAWQNVEAILP